MNINNQSGVSRSPPSAFKAIVSGILFLCFVLAGGVPVRADETPAFLELLDYGYVQHPDHFVSGNRTEIIDEDETVYFQLPYGMTMNYIDMLIYASNSVSIHVSAGHSAWGYSSLSYKKVSNNLWRVYGRIPEHTYERVEIKFSSSSTGGYVNFYSCRVGFNGMNSAPVTLSVTSNNGLSYSWIGSRQYTYTVDPYEADVTMPYNFNLRTTDWVAYDTITLFFSFECDAVTSINATIGTQSVPCEITYFDNIISEDGSFSRYFFSLTLDLTGFERLNQNALNITMQGKLLFNTYSVFQFLYAYGYANVRYADPQLYWYQEIYKALTGPDGVPFLQYIDNALNAVAGVSGNIFAEVSAILELLTEDFRPLLVGIRSYCSSIYTTLDQFKTDVSLRFFDVIDEIRTWGTRLEMALTPNLSEHEESMDQAAEQATEIQDAMQDLEQMEKPEVDDIPSSITTIISGNEIYIATSGLGLLMMNPVLRELLTMAFTLALAAYVLFGKR